MSARTRPRLKVRVVRAPDDEIPEAGAVVCLIAVTDQQPPYGALPHERRWSEVTAYPRTNQGRKPRWAGWLGTTAGLHRQALGAWRITSVAPWEPTSDGVPRWRVRLVEAAQP